MVPGLGPGPGGAVAQSGLKQRAVWLAVPTQRALIGEQCRVLDLVPMPHVTEHDHGDHAPHVACVGAEYSKQQSNYSLLFNIIITFQHSFARRHRSSQRKK